MVGIVHPRRLLKRELAGRKLSAKRLALDIGVLPGRITEILNGRRAITADTAVRLSWYFGNTAQFRLALQTQHDIVMIERKKGTDIARRVRPASTGKEGISSVFDLVGRPKTDIARQKHNMIAQSIEQSTLSRRRRR